MGKRKRKKVSESEVLEVTLPASGGSVAIRGGDFATVGGTTTLRWGDSARDIVWVTPGSELSSQGSITITSTANTWGVARVMDIYFECTLYSGLYATLRLRQGA